MIKILCGDCTELIPKLRDFDFIFADPPFNIKQDYDGYKDHRDDYIDFTQRWVEQCWYKMKETLALHGPDDLMELYAEIAKDLKMKRSARVIWYYRFGQCNRSNWINNHVYCSIYSKRDDYVWNPEAILVDSDRVKYGDSRIYDTVNGGKRVPGTVWEYPRVQGNNLERRPHSPNQLPEAYLERLIKAYTVEGDWILDPFGGSGTTAVVAQALNRNCVTIEISEENCRSIQERVEKGAVRI